MILGYYLLGLVGSFQGWCTPATGSLHKMADLNFKRETSSLCTFSEEKIIVLVIKVAVVTMVLN